LYNKNCAYALANLSKKKKCKLLIENNLKAFEDLVFQFLNSEDAKIRKYGYVISGNFATEKIRKELKNKVNDEKTYFTLPSLMLSLDKESQKSLLARLEQERGNVAPKIYQEIVNNYNLTNPQNFDRCNNLNFQRANFFVTTQKCYEDYLIKKLNSIKKEKLKSGIKLINLTQEEYKNLAKRRDIYSLSVILEESETLEICLKNGLKKLSELVGKGNFSYRISCADKILSDKIIALSKKQQLENLTNSASNYSISVELIQNKKYTLVATLEDLKENFSYRKEFLPASINPVTANIIANICQEFNPNAKVVADVFCGTATMLIERKFVSEKIELIGSDISAIAIGKAKVNLTQAKIKARLYKKDVGDFAIEELDEIVSNLPYGLRVGSHENNEKIYKNLVKVCTICLKKGGFAFLYTADKALLRTLIKKSPLKLVDELNFNSGGLYCTLFVLQKQH